MKTPEEILDYCNHLLDLVERRQFRLVETGAGGDEEFQQALAQEGVLRDVIEFIHDGYE